MLSTTKKPCKTYKTIVHGQEVEIQVYSPQKVYKEEKDVTIEAEEVDGWAPSNTREKDLTEIFKELTYYGEDTEEEDT